MIDLSNVWPEWKAVEKLGEGSFGRVYKCVKNEFGIDFECAIKVISIPSKEVYENIRYNFSSDKEMRTYLQGIVQDFSNEIRLLQTLKGVPSVVASDDYRIIERTDSVGWDIYIKMELLAGLNKAMFFQRLTEGNIKKLASDLLNALAVCRNYNIIHRDIKIGNIFVDKYGWFKLGDFGVAKQLEMTRNASTKGIGTPSCMAPEVRQGKRYDFRADFYSLGMVMYKLLNRNKDPFVNPYSENMTHHEQQDAFERRMRGEKIPAPVDASPRMAAVILKACEFNPDDRFASVEEFRLALEAVEVEIEEYIIDFKQFSEWVNGGAKEEKMNPPIGSDEDGEITKRVIESVPDSGGDVSPEEKPVSEKSKGGIVALVFMIVAAGICACFLGWQIYSVWQTKKAESSSVSSKVSEVFETETPSTTRKIYVVETISEDESLYMQAEKALADGDKAKAAVLFGKSANFGYSDAKKRSMALWSEVANIETFAAGRKHTVAINSDGTVFAVGRSGEGQCDVDEWTNIASVSVGDTHTVGLKTDGTVVAVGWNVDGQCDVDSWTDIVAVSAGDYHTVGLKSDGTVVAVGYNGYGQCNVEGWTDIVAVSSGYYHTVGLKSDGTVVATKYIDSEYSEYDGQCAVDGWTDIVAVSAGAEHTVGFKADGTVVAVGYNGYGQCNVEGWTDIVAVSAGDYHTVGLKSDGTVVAVGWNNEGQCDVDSWTDIVAVSAGGNHTVALKADGTAVAVGYDNDGQCNIDGWSDIVAVSTGDYHTVGLKSDGTVVAGGWNDAGQCDVDSWTDIVAVSAGVNHTVGLKDDGTVVAVGDNEYGQCNVDGWKNIKIPK